MLDHRDLQFRLETWTADDVRPEELLALTSNALIGLAAFKAAVEINPRRRLYLRHGARVVESHSPSPRPPERP